MKRKYEYNFYEPYQYEDLQEHLERMATRGWILERMDPHFLVYRRGGPGLIRYALAYHPEVADMDSSRLPRLEDYAYLCRRAGWDWWTDGPSTPRFRSTPLIRPTPSPFKPICGPSGPCW